ncbi:MAG: hypothetical protein ACE361_17540 [Aureliella sp.]
MKRTRNQLPGRLACCFLLYLAAGVPVASFAAGQAASKSPAERGRGSLELLEAEIEDLIHDLGSTSYQTRTNAQRMLQEHGLAAFEQLFDAARDPETSVQVANAANYIIQSQDVVWYLDTDSIDVRGYLTGYDELSQSQREKRMELLKANGTDDALLALGRLARYERFDENSQTAAIALLTALAEREQIGTDVWQPLLRTVGDSSRPAVQWISTAIGDLQSGEPDLETWKQFASEQAAIPEPRNVIFASQLRSRTFRFFTAACAWIRKVGDRKAALDFGNSCIESASNHSMIRIEDLCSQIIDVWELPEALVQLHNSKPGSFANNPRALYMLAEACRKCGLDSLAERRADSARELVETLASQGRGSTVELVATNRANVANNLAIRGQFDWAEKEYWAAIEALKKARAEDSELPKSTLLEMEAYELEIRYRLSEFLWLGGRNAEAAGALQPAVQDRLGDRSEEQAAENESKGLAEQKRLARQMLWEQGIQRAEASYHYYAGLAAIDAGEDDAARDHLKTAIKLQDDNPDIVIAMRRVADSSEFRELYESKFEQMRSEFRKSVIERQDELAANPLRIQRRSVETNLAMACNQLAWLLGKCETDLDEAIQLSELSNRLVENNPAYLDTLGRCYFSAGRVEDAVETQRQAVKLAPFERLMVMQLEEFEAALAESSADEVNVDGDRSE